MLSQIQGIEHLPSCAVIQNVCNEEFKFLIYFGDFTEKLSSNKANSSLAVCKKYYLIENTVIIVRERKKYE
jgi:hypothetical protein